MLEACLRFHAMGGGAFSHIYKLVYKELCVEFFSKINLQENYEDAMNRAQLQIRFGEKPNKVVSRSLESDLIFIVNKIWETYNMHHF